MESLTTVKSGERCTIKWMFGAPGVLAWMDEHEIRQGSRIRVIQNSIGNLIVGVGDTRVALSREVAERIKI